MYIIPLLFPTTAVLFTASVCQSFPLPWQVHRVQKKIHLSFLPSLLAKSKKEEEDKGKIDIFSTRLANAK
jgi:hypothetical protein